MSTNLVCLVVALFIDHNSYLLATSTFTPLYGRLCNVLGRRGANQVAVISAAAGTLCCGLSQNMEMLIVARFVSQDVSLDLTRIDLKSWHLVKWARRRRYLYYVAVSTIFESLFPSSEILKSLSN